MEYSVIWTNLAFVSLDKNIEALNNNWTNKIVSIFLDKIEEFTQQVRSNPLHYPKSLAFPNYHKAVIHKNTSVFYKIDNKNSIVYINLIWVNKQNPEELFKLLK